jgi:hypothetical protein
MSAIHFLLVEASLTVLLFTVRLGIVASSLGARSAIFLLCNHLSFQNLVLTPSPTSVSTTSLKKDVAFFLEF